ncbi:MAG: hypothetical protein R3E79_09295 [Caldilineaceae bacterium]
MPTLSKLLTIITLLSLTLFLAVSTQPLRVTAQDSDSSHQPPHSGERTVSTENPYWWWSLVHAHDDGNWEIYLRRYDQLNQPEVVRLTNHPATDVDANFSYGAARIVFVSDRDNTSTGEVNTELYLMDADGANVQRLTTNPGRDEMPDWSPTGDKIVFSSSHDDGMEIYVIKADGSAQQRLTYLAGNDWFPTWSPDGQQIAWIRQGVNTGTLWLMNADGSNQHQLTEALRYLSRPVWSPDGRYLAFRYVPRQNELGRIAVIQRDGANLHELACDMADVYEDRAVGAWAPDGSALYYNRNNYNQKGELLWTQVWAMPMSEGNCTSGWGDQVGERQIKVLTDIERADPWPPVSSMQPLPAYSRLPNLLIQLTGQDQGRSGLSHYEVQYRPVYNTAWFDASADSSALIRIENLPAGKLFLRSRARDQANNVEAWPAAEEGEASTTMYRWIVNGRMTDQRGIPLARHALSINPTLQEETATNLDGEFLAYLPDTESILLNGLMQLAAGADWTRNLYVTPQENLIRNGDFEAAMLTNWAVSGSPPQLSNQPVYNGQQSLHLGATCTGACVPQNFPDFPALCIPNVTPGCVSPDAGYPPNYILNPVTLFTDHNNQLHFFGQSQQNELIYQHGAQDQAWDAPIKLADAVFLSTVHAAFSNHGELHVVWSRNDGVIFYGKRASSGQWHTAQPVSSGMDPNVAVDSQGLPHLLYLGNNPYPSEKQSLHYRRMNANGAWSEPVDLGLYPFSSNSLTTIYHDIAITPDDRVHLVWGKPEVSTWGQAYRLIHRVGEPDGRWEPEITINQSATVELIRLFSSAQGELHLLWQQTGTGFYATQLPGMAWTTPAAIDRFDFVTLDGADTLHLVRAPFRTVASSYRYKTPNNGWSDPISMPAAYPPTVTAVSAGITNTLHTLWARDISAVPFYTTNRALTTTTDSQIQQVVSIPAAMHRPTLSFLYALDGGATGASYLEVAVSQRLTTTSVFSTSQSSPWTLGWVDLTRWQSETITLTVKLHQASGDLPMRAYLDDLTLTSWQTPVPQIVTPQQVDPGIAATLVISGENFIATPTVHLETTPLTNVQQVDDQSIRADLPPTLTPGRYRLWVTNPGGSVPMYAGQIQVGQPFYLPLIAR